MNRRNALKGAVAVGFGILSGSVTGCRDSSKGQRITDLSSSQAQSIITQLTEIILPETDTPGAGSLGVGSFVIRVLNDCYPRRERDYIVRSIDEFEQMCFTRFGHSFLQCSKVQQLSLVEELDREALGLWSRIKAKILRYNHFFRTMKRLTLIGYFTSREGATEVLSYDQLPGKWIGCQKLESGQKGWATE